MRKPITPPRITIEIDSREHYPYPFPSTTLLIDPVTKLSQRLTIKTEVRALPYGDYRIKEYPNICCLERKASLSELYSNLCTTDNGRQTRAFAKLTDGCTHPILLLEMCPSEFFQPLSFTKADPERVLDSLLRTLLQNHITLLTVPSARSLTSRRRVGEFLIHYLMNVNLLQESERIYGCDRLTEAPLATG